MIRRPRRSTLFPSTPLSRSYEVRGTYGMGLANTVHPADAMLQPHGVPRDVIVDYHMAELEVQTFTAGIGRDQDARFLGEDRKSTRLNSSHLVISYAVFCLKK